MACRCKRFYKGSDTESVSDCCPSCCDCDCHKEETYAIGDILRITRYDYMLILVPGSANKVFAESLAGESFWRYPSEVKDHSCITVEEMDKIAGSGNYKRIDRSEIFKDPYI